MLSNATGGMPRHSTVIAADSFEWPPADEVLNGQAIAFSPQPLEDARSAGDGVPAPDPEPSPEADAQEVSHPVRHSPARPPSHVSAHTAPSQGSGSAGRTRAWPAWARAHTAHAVMVALALVVVAAGVTIVRTVRLPPVLRATVADSIMPAVTAPEPPPPVAAPSKVGEAPIISSTPVTRRAVDATALGRSRDARQTSSRLIIRSDPAGAAITLDGRAAGVTPRTLTGLPSGDHRVVLSLNGAEVVHSVSLGRGETVSVVAPMRLESGAAGWIAISSPFEVDVYEDGALVGSSRSPRIMLNAGPHALELVNDETGFRQSGRFQVRPGRVEQIGVDVPRSIVHVNAIPWAEIWIDGQRVGETPLGNLSIPIGRHDILFRHPSLGERTITTLVKAGIPTRVTANLRPALAAAQ
jgi:hypothetical protein